VLAGEAMTDIDAYRAAPFDLAIQPLRPGMAHDSLALVLEPSLADAVERSAAADGLPTPLWAAITIESERALIALARATDTDPSSLAGGLDCAASRSPSTLANQRGRRLVRYGLVVRDPAPREPRLANSPLNVIVAHHTVIAWELAAAAEGWTVRDWATVALSRLPPGRGRWESAAVLAGQTLGEWIAVQAARRSSD
jgi:hypothetical protein